jgi:hypothetical protein
MNMMRAAGSVLELSTLSSRTGVGVDEAMIRP